MAESTTARSIRGQVGVHGSWRITHFRPGRFLCAINDCPDNACWKGEIGSDRFNAGRTCNTHWPNLVRICKNLADGWQPAPPRH